MEIASVSVEPEFPLDEYVKSIHDSGLLEFACPNGRLAVDRSVTDAKVLHDILLETYPYLTIPPLCLTSVLRSMARTLKPLTHPGKLPDPPRLSEEEACRLFAGSLASHRILREVPLVSMYLTAPRAQWRAALQERARYDVLVFFRRSAAVRDRAHALLSRTPLPPRLDALAGDATLLLFGLRVAATHTKKLHAASLALSTALKAVSEVWRSGGDGHHAGAVAAAAAVREDSEGTEAAADRDAAQAMFGALFAPLPRYFRESLSPPRGVGPPPPLYVATTESSTYEQVADDAATPSHPDALEEAWALEREAAAAREKSVLCGDDLAGSGGGGSCGGEDESGGVSVVGGLVDIFDDVEGGRGVDGCANVVHGVDSVTTSCPLSPSLITSPPSSSPPLEPSGGSVRHGACVTTTPSPRKRLCGLAAATRVDAEFGPTTRHATLREGTVALSFSCHEVAALVACVERIGLLQRTADAALMAVADARRGDPHVLDASDASSFSVWGMVGRAAALAGRTVEAASSLAAAATGFTLGLGDVSGNRPPRRAIESAAHAARSGRLLVCEHAHVVSHGVGVATALALAVRCDLEQGVASILSAYRAQRDVVELLPDGSGVVE